MRTFWLFFLCVLCKLGSNASFHILIWYCWTWSAHLLKCSTSFSYCSLYSSEKSPLESHIMGQKEQTFNKQTTTALKHDFESASFLFLGLTKTERLHKPSTWETATVRLPSCLSGRLLLSKTLWAEWLQWLHQENVDIFCSNQPSSWVRLHSWPALLSVTTTALISLTVLFFSLCSSCSVLQLTIQDSCFFFLKMGHMQNPLV